MKTNAFLLRMLRLHWAFLALLGAGLAAAISDRLRPVSAVIDVDDTLRRLQIEDLLADNDWFDRTLPIVTPDAPYESPWSRLVDAPYYLITRLLELFMPADRALDIACLVWPPLLLVPLVWLLHGAATALLKRALRPVEVAGAAIFLIQAAVEFAPGRIDHHNVQMVLMALFFRGLTLGNARRAGIVAAAAAVLSLCVGMEAVPLMFAGLAGIAVLGALGDADARRRMVPAGASMACLAPVAGFILTGSAEIWQVHCDAISAPWIGLVTGSGLILAGAPLLWKPAVPSALSQKAFRLATLALPGLALVLALASAFPVCAGGPLHMIDPVTQAFWLDNVPQEASGLTLVSDPANLAFAMLIALAIAAAVLAGADVVARTRAGDDRALLTWIVVLAGILLAVLLVRYARLAFLLAAFILPLAVRVLLPAPGSAARSGRGWKAAALASSGAFLMAGFTPLAGPRFEVAPSYYHFRQDDCAGEDFGVLATLPPGVIMAPFGMQYPVIGAGGGHTLSTISFHRSAPGIRRLALAFTSTDPAVRQKALDGVDYIVVCAADHTAPMDDMPLLRDLARLHPPEGLELIAPEDLSRVKAYRVKRAEP